MKRTEKQKYPSRYSPDGWCHAAQYITEYICEKKARMSKKELPVKFWELPEWLKYFKFQIVLANRLLKEYSEEAIIAALKDSSCFKVYSLNSPVLKNTIKKHQKIKDAQKVEKVEYNIPEGKTFQSSNNKNDKKSIISKLKELDG
jgi:hypothetical protein